MVRSISFAIVSGCLVLCGCASAPIERPSSVAVKTGAVSFDYSSFNARVLNQASAVEASFTTSLREGSVTRLESGYTYKFGDSQDQVRVGDTVSSPGMWGNAVRYGGMQYRSNSETRADVITASELATTGLAVLPTVADALFAATGDPGAALSQQNLSVDRSWNTGGLTARDAYGRSAAIDAPIIARTRLVDSGCSDVAVGAGKVRRDYAITSNEYGPAFANTTVACGGPLGFTIEGHGEFVQDEVAAVGLGLARKVGGLGTASFSYASSHAEAGTGWLAGVGFEHENETFNVAVRSKLQSRSFREVGSVVMEDPIMQRNLASVGVNVLESGNLSLAYATQTTWARERMNIIALQQSLNVGRGSLAMSAGHSLEDNIGSSVFISYKLPLGTVRKSRSAVQEFDPILLDSNWRVSEQ
jgi:outer membrane usher protein